MGPHGECMVSQQLRQQLAQSRYGSQSKFYVAGNATYCSSQDAACQKCTREWLDTEARGKFVSSGAVCVGDGDCLCLSACELSTWETTARAVLCESTTSNNGKSTTSANDYDKISSGDPSTQQLMIAGGACFALVIVFVFIWLGLGRLVRKIDDNAQRARLARLRLPVRVPTGPQLTLEGWTSMRERLVQEDSEGPAPGRAPSLAPIALNIPAPPPAYGAHVEGGDGDDEEEQPSQLWIRW